MLIPFDGTTKNDWQGYIPFDEMPFSFNPDKGYVSMETIKLLGMNIHTIYHDIGQTQVVESNR